MAFNDSFRPNHIIVPLIFAIGISVSACVPGSATTSSSGTTSKPTARTAVGFAQFSDIAVPAGATMDVERSLVLGTRDEWIGRLSMSTGQGPSITYDFFLQEMPKYRWQEITTVRSETSVLTYSRENRIATIQITKRTLGGSKIDVTVSPRGRVPTVPSPITPATE
ncbi:MAG: hypothetical protein CMI96_04595 [Pelagibacteraceae bacterium]|nr:hypothetical protein [Pelagibacteraceae bacterium]